MAVRAGEVNSPHSGDRVQLTITKTLRFDPASREGVMHALSEAYGEPVANRLLRMTMDWTRENPFTMIPASNLDETATFIGRGRQYFLNSHLTNLLSVLPFSTDVKVQITKTAIGWLGSNVSSSTPAVAAEEALDKLTDLVITKKLGPEETLMLLRAASAAAEGGLYIFATKDLMDTVLPTMPTASTILSAQFVNRIRAVAAAALSNSLVYNIAQKTGLSKEQVGEAIVVLSSAHAISGHQPYGLFVVYYGPNSDAERKLLTKIAAKATEK